MKLDGGPRSYLILDFLRRETVERLRNHSHTRLLSLGICIRRLIVNHEGRGDVLNALTPRQPGRSIDDHSADAMDHDEKMRQYRISAEALEQKLEQIYLPNLLFVIPTLIYLDSVDMSHPDWNQNLLNSLTACTIRHLSTDHSTFIFPFPVMDTSIVWPLETLDAKLGMEFDEVDPGNHWNFLLRLCQASVKSLFL